MKKKGLGELESILDVPSEGPLWRLVGAAELRAARAATEKKVDFIVAVGSFKMKIESGCYEQEKDL